MRHCPTWIILLIILLVAAVLRLHGVDWDDSIGAHPDERYIVGIAEDMLWTGQLNPFEFAPDYAYGHLPLYLLAMGHGIAQKADALIIGRVLAALLDVGTVAVTFALGRRVHDERKGLLAAGLIASTVLHVQQSHFYTVDTALGFLTAITVLFACRLAQDAQGVDAWLAGLWAGLAVSTKASAALLVLPLGAACALVSDKRGLRMLQCSAAAIAAFALTSPFALIELPTFLRNVGMQGAILQGTVDVPYTRQYLGTWPYIYPVLQQGRWGMGWLLVLACFGGLIRAVWRAVRRPVEAGDWIMLVGVLPSFALVGALHAKFPRYLLPLTPLLTTYAARLVADLGRSYRAVGSAFCCLLLGSTLFRCASLANMYAVPHPWVSASEWLYANAESGAIIATEAWDHTLPLDTSEYKLRVLPVFEAETKEKWKAIEGALADADYVVIASRRAYGTLADLPEWYPRTAQYYKRLFRGQLGFEPVACFGRFPSLGSVVLADDPTDGLDFGLPEVCGIGKSWVIRLGRLDESFVVYDQPRVLVFRAYR